MLLGQLFLQRIHIPHCSSTNNFLKDMLQEDQNDGDLSGLFVTTDYQTAGRGYGENTWYSSRGKNLLISILASSISIPPEFQFHISRLISLALTDVLEDILPANCEIRIKWPNDVYVNKKKIAGILIESSILGDRIQQSVLGIGFNVHEDPFPASLPMATSLKQLSSQNFDKEDILRMVTAKIGNRNCSSLSELQRLHHEYDRKLFGIDIEMPFRDENGAFKGIITGSDTQGMLNVKTSGEDRKYGFKEIEFIHP